MTPKQKLKFTDLSTEEYFQFDFHCGRCGAGVKSEKYLMNTAGFKRPPQGRARALLWSKQHDEAYERAHSEALYEFNVCSRCGRRVCNTCFHVSPEGAAGVCDDC